MAMAQARILAAIKTTGGPGTVPEPEEARSREAEQTGHSEAFLRFATPEALFRCHYARLAEPTTVSRVQLTGPSGPDVFLTEAEVFAAALGGTFDDSSAQEYSPAAEIVITYTFPGDQVFSPSQWYDGRFEVRWGGRRFLVQSPELERLLQERGFTYP